MVDSPLTHAGTVIYRLSALQESAPAPPEFLLVESRRSRGDWVFPKGHIERGELPEQTALREAREEAGAEGIIEAELGRSEFLAPRGQVRALFFLMRFTRDVPPTERRRREWVSAEKAAPMLRHTEALRVLQLALDQLRASDERVRANG